MGSSKLFKDNPSHHFQMTVLANLHKLNYNRNWLQIIHEGTKNKTNNNIRQLNEMISYKIVQFNYSISYLRCCDVR